MRACFPSAEVGHFRAGNESVCLYLGFDLWHLTAEFHDRRSLLEVFAGIGVETIYQTLNLLGEPRLPSFKPPLRLSY